MTEPKLLTEAEVRGIYNCAADGSDLITMLRERGLIAPEPVDPLMVEARAFERLYHDDEYVEPRDMALAAIKRGMELGRAERQELTREMVRKALDSSGYGTVNRVRLGFLHTALIKQMQP